ncbi:hypothetical protein DSO57_1027855 [Entomophthora muscae]|uniref:Uncharacterized protein n=1 Tax=Entomophthora muscae TaxID=34485 RepID=A0ACC2SER0_9FUNG|nr:hypothetical protein DSO57_1027855 [Entomophthora muscae]
MKKVKNFQTKHKALLYCREPRLFLGRQSQWHEDFSRFWIKYKFIKEHYNHLTDALSCNPAHLPNVKLEQEFNTRIFIPKGQILSEPTLLAPSVEQKGHMMKMDLASKVKLLQPLYLRYNQLLQMVSSSAFQEFHYAVSEGILHFMIQVWVPEGTIRGKSSIYTATTP